MSTVREASHAGSWYTANGSSSIFCSFSRFISCIASHRLLRVGLRETRAYVTPLPRQWPSCFRLTDALALPCSSSYPFPLANLQLAPSTTPLDPLDPLRSPGPRLDSSLTDWLAAVNPAQIPAPDKVAEPEPSSSSSSAAEELELELTLPIRGCKAIIGP